MIKKHKRLKTRRNVKDYIEQKEKHRGQQQLNQNDNKENNSNNN